MTLCSFIQHGLLIVHSEALDMHLSVGILRTQDGMDFSSVIEEEDQMTPQQLMQEAKKEKEIPRNQSESQLSQGTFSFY